MTSGAIQRYVPVSAVSAPLRRPGWRDMPIVAVIHPVASAKYRRMFHLLWRLKRVEWSLSLAWRQNMTAARARLASALPRLSVQAPSC